jgi:D-alanyl-D-alanine endopeptidase (penicillin-binding protein 7)
VTNPLRSPLPGVGLSHVITLGDNARDMHPLPRQLSLVLTVLTVSLATLLGSSPTAASRFLQRVGSPDLRSEAAYIVDASGELIYGKNADSVRPVASITKLMTAMVIIDSGLDLDERITVTKADRDLVQLTGSRLEYGAQLSRREMIMLAIMSSENRAASSLGRNYPGGTEAFVSAMNAKAGLLNMRHSQFADPAGLRVENRSTARDLSAMIQAAYSYPLIRKASTTRRLEVRPYRGRGPLVYGNTNRLLKNPTWEIGLSKTGYLSEAGRCLVMQARIDGEEVFIVLLDSFGKLTPFGDSNRLRRWLLADG